MARLSAPQPKARATGAGGALLLGRVRVGALRDWRLVISPTTRRPTLIADARVARAWLHAPPSTLTALVTPAPTPALLGRPAPPRPRPLRISGRVARLTAAGVTLAECEIETAQ